MKYIYKIVKHLSIIAEWNVAMVSTFAGERLLVPVPYQEGFNITLYITPPFLRMENKGRFSFMVLFLRFLQGRFSNSIF